MAVNKPQTDTLQAELDEYFSNTKQVDPISLSKLPYLDAVINETMRLHPPVPSGTQRQTPAEGLQVGDIFIPGNTLVRVPMYTVSRGMTVTRYIFRLSMLKPSDERYFEKPLKFIPERWTTERELTKNSSVFIPFLIGTATSRNPVRNTKMLTGPYSCVGKQLALMELRYVVAQIVHRYDVELATGENRKRFEDGMRDNFTLSLGPLNMVFSHRK